MNNAGISVKPSYLPAEVQQILNIKYHTFRLMCEKWGRLAQQVGQRSDWNHTQCTPIDGFLFMGWWTGWLKIVLMSGSGPLQRHGVVGWFAK